MIFKILVIAFFRMSFIQMEANLPELCSKSYFDSFEVRNKEYLGHYLFRYDFLLSRRLDSKSYHSWHLLMEEDNNPDIRGFKLIDMSYKVEVGQTPISPLSQQKECEIRMKSEFWFKVYGSERRRFTWNIKDILMINDRTDGPKLNYTQPYMEYYGQNENKRHKEMTVRLNSPGILLSGLFCRPLYSEVHHIPHTYVIVENANLLNAWNRTQFVSRLHIEPGPNINATTIGDTATFLPEPKFWLDSTDKTIVDFLGIQCPEIEDSVPTTTLWTVFFTLIGTAVILLLAILGAVIYRRRIRFPTESVDGTSVETAVPSEEQPRRGLFGQFTSQEQRDAINLLCGKE